MTNELLSYIKDTVSAIILLAVSFGWITITENQLANIGIVVLLLGGLAVRINTVRKGGAVQALREKAAVAEEAGLVTSDGPPPEGDA